MFSPEFYIDSFQNTKKIVADKIFTDPALNKAAHAYIDAQTKFAKVISSNVIEVARYSVESVSQYLFPKTEQASKAPYKVEKEAN